VGAKHALHQARGPPNHSPALRAPPYVPGTSHGNFVRIRGDRLSPLTGA